MSEPRTFTLIGRFDDGITKHLESINRSISGLKKNLQSLSGTEYRSISKEIGRVAAASSTLTDSLRNQGRAFRSVLPGMREYRRELGKIHRAQHGASGASRGRRSGYFAPPPPPRVPRFAAPPPPPPPRTPRYQTPIYGGGGRIGGGGGRIGGGGGYGAAVGGAVFGTQLSQMMTSAIVAGFQMGTSLMAKPFQYIRSGMAERIADEMSDVRAAGGLYAVNKLLEDQGKQGFLTGGFREAEEVTKENNRYLAKLAGSLPGSTQEYIQVSKQLSDGIYRVLSEDKENFMKLGVKVATEAGRVEQVKKIQGGGTKGMQAAGTEVLGDMTKLTVLAGLGGRQGAFGLPQLTERMFSEQQVSMGRMQRYSAIFRDPMIMGALERNVAKINQTQANTADRIDKIRDMYQEIVTPELVSRFRRTTEGVLESLNTIFLNPEVGLLGLGRPIDGLGKKFNDFGQYLNDLGDVTTEVSEAASADLSLCEGLRDTFAFLYQTIEPILDVIPLIYDPLKDLGIELEKVREVTASVFRRFNEYRVFFEEMGGEFKGTAALRASLATLTQLFTDFGIFNTDDFKRLQDIISGKDFSIEKAGAIVQEMLEKFFDSDLAESIGNAIGRLIGTIIKTVGEMASQVSEIASAGGLAKGLSEGFKAAGGREGIRLIFKSLIDLFLKAVRELFAAAPLEMSLITGFAMFGPALAATLGTLLGQKLIGAVPTLAKGLFKWITSSISSIKPVKVTDLGNTTPITDPRRMLPPGKTPSLPSVSPGAVKGMKFFDNFFQHMAGVGPRFLGFFKGLTGKIAILAGVLTTITSLFQGESLAKSLAQGAGPVLGAALGAALLPFLGPIGPMIGSWVGSLRPVVDTLEGVFEGIGWALSNAWDTVGPLIEGLGGIVKTLWDSFWGLIPGVDGLAESFDFLNFAFKAVKFILFPFVSALNGVVFAIQAVQRGLLEFDKFINEKFQFGDRQGRLQAAIDKTTAEMEKTAARQIALNNSLFEEAPTRGKVSTPASPQAAAVPVPTVAAPVFAAPALPPQDSEAAKTTASNVQQLNTKAATQISHAAAISNKLTSIQSAAPPNQDSVKIAALQQTVLNTSQINEKTAALVTQSTNIFRATDGTQKNTAMANVHLTTINSGVVAVSSKLSGIQSAVVRDLGAIQAGVSSISKLLASGNIKVQADFNLGGGALGGGDGGPPVFGAAASKLGLTMTSGYRPGDPGYHGLNRARDYSNGSGPTPQMMMFAQFLASTFGKNLKELIYTPMGFSIKNGVKVPPYAQSTHYDHVHVAYALGAGNPAFFSEQRDAVAWEKKFLGRGVESITTNTAELAQAGDGMIGPGWLPWNWGKLVDQERKTNKLNRTNQMLEQMQREGNLPSGMRRISTEGMYPGGGSSVSSAPINVTSPITINQQPGQNADELASIVAMKIGEAVADARAASIFV